MPPISYFSTRPSFRNSSITLNTLKSTNANLLTQLPDLMIRSLLNTRNLREKRIYTESIMALWQQNQESHRIVLKQYPSSEREEHIEKSDFNNQQQKNEQTDPIKNPTVDEKKSNLVSLNPSENTNSKNCKKRKRHSFAPNNKKLLQFQSPPPLLHSLQTNQKNRKPTYNIIQTDSEYDKASNFNSQSSVFQFGGINALRISNTKPIEQKILQEKHQNEGNIKNQQSGETFTLQKQFDQEDAHGSENRDEGSLVDDNSILDEKQISDQDVQHSTHQQQRENNRYPQKKLSSILEDPLEDYSLKSINSFRISGLAGLSEKRDSCETKQKGNPDFNNTADSDCFSKISLRYSNMNGSGLNESHLDFFQVEEGSSDEGIDEFNNQNVIIERNNEEDEQENKQDGESNKQGVQVQSKQVSEEQSRQNERKLRAQLNSLKLEMRRINSQKNKWQRKSMKFEKMINAIKGIHHSVEKSIIKTQSLNL